MLFRMRRNHTREAYIELVQRIREKIPGVAISGDFIAGFCGETEEEFADTLSLIQTVKYDQAYLYAYSLREKTHAHRKMNDDVPKEVKQARLEEMIKVFKKHQLEQNMLDIGRYHLMLVDGISKRSEYQYTGLTDTNKRIVFDKRTPVYDSWNSFQTDAVTNPNTYAKIGDYVLAKVYDATQNTLF